MLFVATFSMLVLLIVLFQYSTIQNDVKKNSRCLREKLSGQSNGMYVVTAKNETDEKLYNITYDLRKKEYNVSCACTPGDTVNHFNDIKVYDMRNPSNPIRRINEKMCYCDKFVEPNRTYYFGYPDILRFMNSGDTSFFTNYAN